MINPKKRVLTHSLIKNKPIKKLKEEFRVARKSIETKKALLNLLYVRLALHLIPYSYITAGKEMRGYD